MDSAPLGFCLVGAKRRVPLLMAILCLHYFSSSPGGDGLNCGARQSHLLSAPVFALIAPVHPQSPLSADASTGRITQLRSNESEGVNSRASCATRLRAASQAVSQLARHDRQCTDRSPLCRRTAPISGPRSASKHSLVGHLGVIKFAHPLDHYQRPLLTFNVIA